MISLMLRFLSSEEEGRWFMSNYCDFFFLFFFFFESIAFVWLRYKESMQL